MANTDLNINDESEGANWLALIEHLVSTTRYSLPSLSAFILRTNL
jgi:hypothetical protein